MITSRQRECAEISFSARRVIGLAFPDFVAGNARAQWAIVANQIQIVFGLVIVVALGNESHFGAEAARHGRFAAELAAGVAEMPCSPITFD